MTRIRAHMTLERVSNYKMINKITATLPWLASNVFHILRMCDLHQLSQSGVRVLRGSIVGLRAACM